MAGVSVGDAAENPVAINVTPLVDILFCLCVFFMISFKFKQQEGRFDAWLPKNTGVRGPAPAIDFMSEIRIALFWDEAAGRVVRQFGSRRADADAELGQLLREAHDDCVRFDRPDCPATIDAEARVPWQGVVDVIDLCRRSGIQRIEFALRAPDATPR